MSTIGEVRFALRKYIDRTAVIDQQGELWMDTNGKPIAIFVAEAINALAALPVGER